MEINSNFGYITENMNKNQHFILLITGIFVILSACKKDSQTEPSETPGIFDIVWNDFDKTYPYFIHKGINWDSVYTVYSSRINDSTSDQELFQIIGEMTLVLKDIHVYLKSSLGTIHYSKKGNYPENPPDSALNYLDEIIMNNSKGLLGVVVNSNYSYLRIKTFVGDDSDFSSILSSLGSIKDKDGLIIDIRANGGGNELNGRAIAGRFVSTDTPYRYARMRDGSSWNSFTPWYESILPSVGYLNFHKPVILLTNRRVYSSSELFVLMMKSYPELIIVGDTTGAASANPALRVLPNGWQYRISTWQAASLDYTLIEDIGIPPDHYVLMTENSISERKDLIMEKAIELLDMQ